MTNCPKQFLIIIPTNSVLDQHAVSGHAVDHLDNGFGLTDDLSAHLDCWPARMNKTTNFKVCRTCLPPSSFLLSRRTVVPLLTLLLGRFRLTWASLCRSRSRGRRLGFFGSFGVCARLWRHVGLRRRHCVVFQARRRDRVRIRISS